MNPKKDRAIMFADIRGFTSFTQEQGDEVAFELAQSFVGLIEQNLVEFDGEIAKTLGDGALVKFPSPTDAILSSLTLQEQLGDYNSEQAIHPIAVGLGLTWGRVIESDRDLFGTSVNLVQRLSDTAKGGQVLVSPEVKQAPLDLEGIRFLDLGKRQLKGFGSTRLFELVWRNELARISPNQNQINLILTEDQLILALSKEVQQEMQSAWEELAQSAGNRGGFSGWLYQKAARMVDKLLAKVGVGMEHALQDVAIRLTENQVQIETPGWSSVKLDRDEFDQEELQQFVRKYKQLKSDFE